MFRFKVITYKLILFVLLRLPDAFYAILFQIAFPIYKALHTKRAYGRVERLLQETGFWGKNAYRKRKVSPKDVFESIYWNDIYSYRLLARIPSATARVRFENEFIMQDAAKAETVVGMSIHQGAFENMHRILCRYSDHVHLITDSAGDAALRKCLEDLRSDPHLTEYHPDKLQSLIRGLFKTRGILAMVVDQGRNTKGNTTSLFGKDNTLYLRLPVKVNQMGASIVTFRTYSETVVKRGKKVREHVIRFEHYYPPKMSCTPEGEAKLIAAIAADVEHWIKEHPEQWTWNYHKNFKV
ncbi:MAG: lauroyl acyltransferase [Fibrobacter sp.]|nr:lauroyl acyltransferase [Fibrobacter sp.]